MSGQRESEDDVDIYGDLPNFACIGDTVKEVSMLRQKTLFEIVNKHDRTLLCHLQSALLARPTERPLKL
jgi:hypothetical protein